MIAPSVVEHGNQILFSFKDAGPERIASPEIPHILPMGENADQMGIGRHGPHRSLMKIHQAEVVGVLFAEFVFKGEVPFHAERAEFGGLPDNFNGREKIRFGHPA